MITVSGTVKKHDAEKVNPKIAAGTIEVHEENIREVTAFPMNSNAQDLLMDAPCEVTEQQLREVHIKVRN